MKRINLAKAHSTHGVQESDYACDGSAAAAPAWPVQTQTTQRQQRTSRHTHTLPAPTIRHLSTCSIHPFTPSRVSVLRAGDETTQLPPRSSSRSYVKESGRAVGTLNDGMSMNGRISATNVTVTKPLPAHNTANKGVNTPPKSALPGRERRTTFTSTR